MPRLLSLLAAILLINGSVAAPRKGVTQPDARPLAGELGTSALQYGFPPQAPLVVKGARCVLRNR